MKKTILTLLLGMSITYFGCENMAPESPDETPGEADCSPLFPEMNVTYDNYVKGIMDQYCISCHYTGNSQGPGDFSTYNGVKASVDYFFVRVIQDNADMPQGNAPLPESIRDSLNIWIENCAPEN